VKSSNVKSKLGNTKYVLTVLESENTIRDGQNYPFIPEETRIKYSKFIEHFYLTDKDIDEFENLVNRFKNENYLRNHENYPFLPIKSYERYINVLNTEWQDLDYIGSLINSENNLRNPKNYPFVSQESYDYYIKKLND
jgi:hypothetical protein